jgi:hypothetical protein
MRLPLPECAAAAAYTFNKTISTINITQEERTLLQWLKR